MMVILQITSNNPGEQDFATPYDSSAGIPTYVAVIGIILILYIVFRVWWRLRKDRQ